MVDVRRELGRSAKEAAYLALGAAVLGLGWARRQALGGRERGRAALRCLERSLRQVGRPPRRPPASP